jgi:fumarylacetoacetate (FAA) hydrolase family protein
VEFGGVTLGLREGVIALITLVVAYIVFVLLRMYRLHRHSADTAAPLAQAEPEMPPVTEALPADSEQWEKAPVGLADEMLLRSLEQEVAQLRDEVDSIRGELAALRQDLLQEVAHMQAAQAVSPIYGDAMQMAAAGYDPAMIAERCGIARAEAELVVALAKSQER